MLVACRLAGLSALDSRSCAVLVDGTLAVGGLRRSGQRLGQRRFWPVSRFRRSKHRLSAKSRPAPSGVRFGAHVSDIRAAARKTVNLRQL